MATTVPKSDFASEPHGTGVQSSPAFAAFPAFESPSSGSIGEQGSPESQHHKKRKRAEPDDSATESASHGLFAAVATDSPSNAGLDQYIKSKRKPREKKACQICRKRKVACDQQQPCLNCIERRYPELCVYENTHENGSIRTDAGPSQAGADPMQILQPSQTDHSSLLNPAETTRGSYSPEKLTAGLSRDTVTLPRDSFERLLAKLDHFQKTSGDLTSEIRALVDEAPSTSAHTENGLPGPGPYQNSAPTAAAMTAEPSITDGIHSKNALTGQTVHVGGNSVPAFVMQYSNHLEDLLGTSILPAFGLENESATYPFMSLSDLMQGRLSRVMDLCKTLPPEPDIDRYFRSFRDISGVVYPAIARLDRFENELLQFHIARAQAPSQPIPTEVDEQTVYGKNLDWIGLLFAAMASGCQCTDISLKELDLTSRVFVCCSFECLRMTNFLSNPSHENVQTLLILGTVISNTMNAGVAWSLMGMTTRLAQVLGLHRPCKDSVPQDVRDERRKIAWTMMWQESLLSLTFDRAPASTVIFLADTKNMPYDSYELDGSWSYAGCMYQVTKVGLELIQDRRKPRSASEMLQQMKQYKEELRQIMSNAAPHLQSSQHCKSLREQLQHWALYLHTSYILSEVCREAIKPSASQSELAKNMRQTCLDSLTNTVRAFLGLNRLTAFASHSWSALSRGLSCALVLGILGFGGEKNDEVHALLNQLLVLLHEVSRRNGEGSTELSTPINRWISTLRRLTAGKPVGARHSSSSASTSPMLDFDSDESPYAQADSIIWGNGG